MCRVEVFLGVQGGGVPGCAGWRCWPRPVLRLRSRGLSLLADGGHHGGGFGDGGGGAGAGAVEEGEENIIIDSNR